MNTPAPHAGAPIDRAGLPALFAPVAWIRIKAVSAPLAWWAAARA